MKIRKEVIEGVREICASHKGEPSPLMMILSDIQNKYGYIPLEVQEVVSEETGIPVAEIYGVVTFYAFFSVTPKGKYVIGVCLGTACYVKNSQSVIDLHHRGRPLHRGLCPRPRRQHQRQGLSDGEPRQGRRHHQRVPGIGG